MSGRRDAGLDYRTILDQLCCMYDDANKKTKAQARLQTLHQKNDNFPTFLAKLERLFFEADATA